MSPKVLLTFAFQLMMGWSSIPPSPLLSPSHSLENVWSNANEQAKESKSISQLHSKMPIAFDFDFDTSLGGDSHCPECLLPSSCCGYTSLYPSFCRNCCVAPVWCFEPRVATLSVCECERAVDRSTTIEVIVSEILGFFSKLSESRGRVWG